MKSEQISRTHKPSEKRLKFVIVDIFPYRTTKHIEKLIIQNDLNRTDNLQSVIVVSDSPSQVALCRKITVLL